MLPDPTPARSAGVSGLRKPGPASRPGARAQRRSSGGAAPERRTRVPAPTRRTTPHDPDYRRAVPDDLADRLASVQQRVAAAARAAHRDPAEITTIVVTKFQPLELIQRLFDLGVRDFGESRHPEARDKAAALPEATWHFIGQLQTNKARQVARYADVVHSVDRPELVDALAGRELDVLLQVDLGVGKSAGRGGAPLPPAPRSRPASSRIAATAPQAAVWSGESGGRGGMVATLSPWGGGF